MIATCGGCDLWAARVTFDLVSLGFTHDRNVWRAQAVAKSFGFSVPPRVNLPVESKSSHTRKVGGSCPSARGQSSWCLPYCNS